MSALHSDTSGTYVTTLTREEWEKERDRSDVVHVVQPERTKAGES